MISHRIPTQTLIERFRNRWHFESLCRACPGYGHRWGCPPFDRMPYPDLSAYPVTEIYVEKIELDHAAATLDDLDRIIEAKRRIIEPSLLEREAATKGLAALFTGRCYHCGKEPCTRAHGAPCRHPDLVRPSLEALGFDISAITSQLFGISIQWARNGQMPPYLTIVGAIFTH